MRNTFIPLFHPFILSLFVCLIGRWCGSEVVVKRAKLGGKTSRLEELENECRAYKALESLQGLCLPLVLWNYRTSDTLYLLLERVKRRQAGQQQSAISPEQCACAFQVRVDHLG